jgi:hypothetical protein
MAIQSVQHDYLFSILSKVTATPEAARELAGAIVQAALDQGQDVDTVIDRFKKTPPGNLSITLAAFLNDKRMASSYLGIKVPPATSKYVSRLIIQ